jgi:hypothetical protein
MFEGISENKLQADLARIFGRIWEEKGPQALEREAAGAIAGLSSLIYRACGPERLGEILEAAPDAIERQIAEHFKQFNFQIIPTDKAEPIRKGVAMMWEKPHFWDLRRVIEPHLCGHRFSRLEVLHEGRLLDMFTDSSAGLVGLPRNDRATAILRNGCLTERPDLDPESLSYVAGPAVLFDELVWSD